MRKGWNSIIVHLMSIVEALLVQIVLNQIVVNIHIHRHILIREVKLLVWKICLLIDVDTVLIGALVWVATELLFAVEVEGVDFTTEGTTWHLWNLGGLENCNSVMLTRKVSLALRNKVLEVTHTHAWPHHSTRLLSVQKHVALLLIPIQLRRCPAQERLLRPTNLRLYQWILLSYNRFLLEQSFG